MQANQSLDDDLASGISQAGEQYRLYAASITLKALAYLEIVAAFFFRADERSHKIVCRKVMQLKKSAKHGRNIRQMPALAYRSIALCPDLADAAELSALDKECWKGIKAEKETHEFHGAVIKGRNEGIKFFKILLVWQENRCAGASLLARLTKHRLL